MPEPGKVVFTLADGDNPINFEDLHPELDGAVQPSAFLDEEPDTTTGLTWGWKGRWFETANGIINVPSGTITLTDNAVNYIELDFSDATVKLGSGGFTPGRWQISQITTLNGVRTARIDKRTWLNIFSAGTTQISDTVNAGTIPVGSEISITIDHSAKATFSFCEYPVIVSSHLGLEITVLAHRENGDRTNGSHFVLLVQNISDETLYSNISIEWLRRGVL